MCPLSANPVFSISEPSATSALPSRRTWQNQLRSLWSVLALITPTHSCTAPPRVTSTNCRGFRTLAKLVCPGHTHSSDALRFLHWLPVRQRIDFNIATLTFKLLNFDSPNYLACLLKPYLPARALHSHGQRLLTRPRVKTCIGSRAFRVAAPSVWNSLPLHVRSTPSIDIFRRELKTHLFTMKS